MPEHLDEFLTLNTQRTHPGRWTALNAIHKAYVAYVRRFHLGDGPTSHALTHALTARGYTVEDVDAARGLTTVVRGVRLIPGDFVAPGGAR